MGQITQTRNSEFFLSSYSVILYCLPSFVCTVHVLCQESEVFAWHPLLPHLPVFLSLGEVLESAIEFLDLRWNSINRQVLLHLEVVGCFQRGEDLVLLGALVPVIVVVQHVYDELIHAFLQALGQALQSFDFDLPSQLIVQREVADSFCRD